MIEDDVENVFIALMQAREELAGLPVVHRNEDDQKPKNAIIVGAVASERQAEGPRGDALEVTCELRSVTGMKAERDALAKVMRSAITSPAVVDLSAFTDFWIFDEEMTGEREDGENARSRTLTVPVVAVSA